MSSETAQSIVQTLHASQELIQNLPALVLKVMSVVENTPKLDKTQKCQLALEVIAIVAPSSNVELVKQLIQSFIEVSKTPAIIQTVNLVKEAAERIDDEISGKGGAGDGKPKPCCTIC